MMGNSNNKINLEDLLQAYNLQNKIFGEVNKKLFCEYLNFRETQWKKCNTTLNNILEDNKNQLKMLSNGNIHIKMFYRTIQFAIYHEVNTMLIKQRKLIKPQKIANLEQEISYFDIFEISEALSKKLGLDINPYGLINLIDLYISEKRDLTNEMSAKKLAYLDISNFNKTTAKTQELQFDHRMNFDCRVSLKILHLAIQYVCTHLLEPQILQLNSLINFNIAKVHLNSCRHMNRDYEVSYSLNNVAILFSYYLNKIAEIELMVA